VNEPLSAPRAPAQSLLAALNADPEVAAAARLDPKQRAAQRVQIDWRAKLTALSERVNQ
jgi:hypothetical protein